MGDSFDKVLSCSLISPLHTAKGTMRVYPNPSTGRFTVELPYA